MDRHAGPEGRASALAWATVMPLSRGLQAAGRPKPGREQRSPGRTRRDESNADGERNRRKRRRSPPAARRQRRRDGRAGIASRGADTALRRHHRARQFGPRGAFSQALHRAQARPRLRLAGALDRLALPRAAPPRRRGRDHDFPVGPQPGHRRHAGRGKSRRRAGDRPRQRRGLAAGAGSRRAPGAARGRGALGRGDQVGDRLARRRLIARRQVERRRSAGGRARPVAVGPRSEPRTRRRTRRSKRSPRPARSSSSAAARPSPSPPRRR